MDYDGGAADALVDSVGLRYAAATMRGTCGVAVDTMKFLSQQGASGSTSAVDDASDNIICSARPCGI